MSRARPAFWWLLAGPVVVLTAVLVRLFPYMAITDPSGSRTLVVEGWMDPDMLQEAARTALDSGYSKIYTTGTVRSFSYYLEPGEALELDAEKPWAGRIAIDASGVDGAGFRLLSGPDTILDQAVSGAPTIYRASLPRPEQRLRVVAWNVPMHAGVPELFIRMLAVEGVNVNRTLVQSRFVRTDGRTEPAWPTYAHAARATLIADGVPADRITAVPAFGDPKSRSWANAHAFAQQAHADGLRAFDIATAGVHARRSRDLFRTACGPNVRVGVIALNDPYCTRSNWWKSFRGWYTVLKELLGATEVQAVEIAK